MRPAIGMSLCQHDAFVERAGWPTLLLIVVVFLSSPPLWFDAFPSTPRPFLHLPSSCSSYFSRPHILPFAGGDP